MIFDEVKKKLVQQGWHLEAQPFGGALWMAWQKLKNVPDCADNERPPCVTIFAYSTARDNAPPWNTFAVKVAGAFRDSQWVELRVYGIAPADLLPRLTDIVDRLAAAWTAAVYR